MRKRFVFVSIAAILLMATVVASKVMNPLNLGISPLMTADGEKPEGRRIEISFSYQNLALVASNQFAFWIEDMDGNYVDTLYVTRYTSQEGHRRRPNSIPAWVSASKIADMRNSGIEAIAGATPKPGEYVACWDFTDSDGNLAEGSQFRYFIEASVMNDDTAMYSGVIKAGQEMQEEQPAPEYSNPSGEYNDMLSNVRVIYYPG
ncbi:MAG: DUF2271 domain-containing protein [Clostridiales bacterium]|jgi:hypothetical protein|nr:DUF2271 domain-containing protein [Clostridiales bacterium]